MARQTGRFIWALVVGAVMGLIVGCGGDVAGPAEVAVDLWRSTTWEYHYTNKATGRTIGLDSVRGNLVLALARAPEDYADVSTARGIVLYLWQVDSASTDTLRGAVPIWPAGGTTRGRYVAESTLLRLVDMRPRTFLDHPNAVFERAHVDTLVYVLALVSDARTETLVIPWVR